jgi:hypothetical protein
MARKTRADRNYDRYAELRARMIDAYRSAIHFKSTHTDLLARLRERIYETKEYRSLPEKYKGMLSECSRCWGDRVNELHLVWRLGNAEGPITSARPGEWTEALSELANKPGALYGSHFWAGSDRLYGDWKPIN